MSSKKCILTHINQKKKIPKVPLYLSIKTEKEHEKGERNIPEMEINHKRISKCT
jgi:hypothetical protein